MSKTSVSKSSKTIASKSSKVAEPKIIVPEAIESAGGSDFAVGDLVLISENATSVPKKFRGTVMTVTQVGKGGKGKAKLHLYGDNPDNRGPSGEQVDPTKRLWPLAEECSRA